MWYNSIIGTDFNPRSREGSDTMSKKLSKKPIDFNPRSREGSDGKMAKTNKIVTISILAPARGATRRESMCM